MQSSTGARSRTTASNVVSLATTSGVTLEGDKVFWRGLHYRLKRVNALLSAGVAKFTGAEDKDGKAVAYSYKGAVRWSLLGAIAKEVATGYEGRLGLFALLLDKAMDGGYLSKAMFATVIGRTKEQKEEKLVALLKTLNNDFPGHAVQGVVGAALFTVEEKFNGC